MKNVKGLIFFYNAQSGISNAILDYVHKIFSPSTYDCNLCSLTYNNFGMINQWKKFIRSIKIPVHFQYADHLNTYGIDIDSDLPAIFTLNGELFLSAKKINSCTTLDELINVVRVKIRFHKEN